MANNTSTGTCERCGEPFQRTTPKKRFCSEACREKAERARKAKRRKDAKAIACDTCGTHFVPMSNSDRTSCTSCLPPQVLANSKRRARSATFICRSCGGTHDQRTKGQGRPWVICRTCADLKSGDAYKVTKSVKCRMCSVMFTARAAPSVTMMVCQPCKKGSMRAYKEQLCTAIKQARKRRAETAASIYLEARCTQCHRTTWLDGVAVSRRQRTCGATRCQNIARWKTTVYRDGIAHKNYIRRSAVTGGDAIKRSMVWDRDQGRCHICKEQADPNDWHLDHVVPLARGGQHTWDNVAVSHAYCNLSKGARLSTASTVSLEA